MNRLAPGGPLAHVVLIEPEIPNNTGNIGRTCVGLGAALTLVHPLGFEIDEKACRRAGLDYWPRLSLTEFDRFDAYRDVAPRDRVWAFSARASRTVFDVPLRRGDHLVFGRESTGLSDAAREAFADRLVRLPMAPGERSLNLATAVGVALFETLRRATVAGEVTLSDAGDVVL